MGQRGALASAQARTGVPSPGEGAPAGRGLHRSRLQTVAELVVIKCVGGGGGGGVACGGRREDTSGCGRLGAPSSPGSPILRQELEKAASLVWRAEGPGGGREGPMALPRANETRRLRGEGTGGRGRLLLQGRHLQLVWPGVASQEGMAWRTRRAEEHSKGA